MSYSSFFRYYSPEDCRPKTYRNLYNLFHAVQVFVMKSVVFEDNNDSCENYDRIIFIGGSSLNFLAESDYKGVTRKNIFRQCQ